MEGNYAKPRVDGEEIVCLHFFQASGLVPKYTNKKVGTIVRFGECTAGRYMYFLPPPQDYGKVPAYLEQHRREMAEAQEQYDRYVQESLRRGQMQQVAADKRYSNCTMHGKLLYV